ncbi:MAG: hypothetical protein MUQ56_09535 [Thermoleophilia bacterium]|nr:hypothetical protein [Thermoleophilia bacterium]
MLKVADRKDVYRRIDDLRRLLRQQADMGSSWVGSRFRTLDPLASRWTWRRPDGLATRRDASWLVEAVLVEATAGALLHYASARGRHTASTDGARACEEKWPSWLKALAC